MSHTVRVTRIQPMVSSNQAVHLNSGYLGSISGLLKLTQLLLGAPCIGIVGYYMDHKAFYSVSLKAELFYLLVAVTFFIGTFCLFTSCLMSHTTASIISKTIHEVIYHGLACIMYLAAGLNLMVEIKQYKKLVYVINYEAYFAASIMGLIIAVLYLLSTIFAYRSYRGF